MSGFSKNTIELDAVSDSKVPLPDSSSQLKVYFDGVTIKQVGFDGKVTPLVPSKQQIKVIDAKVTTEVADVTKFTFRVPNVSKKVNELNALVNKINSDVSGFASSEQVASLVTAINDSISKLNEEIKLVDGKFADLEQTPVTQEQLKAVYYNISLVQNDQVAIKSDNKTNEQLIIDSQKASSSQIANVESLLSDKISNLVDLLTSLNNMVALSATQKQLNVEIAQIKTLIPKPFKIVAGTSNVHIAELGNEFSVSVEIPEITRELITKEIVQQVGGGCSRSTVKKIVDDAIALIPAAVSAAAEELSSDYTYNLDESLATKTTSAGSQTYSYNGSAQLVSIVGTGIYKSKTFSYNGSGQLTHIEIS